METCLALSSSSSPQSYTTCALLTRWISFLFLMSFVIIYWTSLYNTDLWLEVNRKLPFANSKSTAVLTLWKGFSPMCEFCNISFFIMDWKWTPKGVVSLYAGFNFLELICASTSSMVISAHVESQMHSDWGLYDRREDTYRTSSVAVKEALHLDFLEYKYHSICSCTHVCRWWR